jgi:hypothetical protein
MTNWLKRSTAVTIITVFNLPPGFPLQRKPKPKAAACSKEPAEKPTPGLAPRNPASYLPQIFVPWGLAVANQLSERTFRDDGYVGSSFVRADFSFMRILLPVVETISPFHTRYYSIFRWCAGRLPYLVRSSYPADFGP